MIIQPILKKLYPEGSVQGQCGVFAHRVISFVLVGNTLAQKTQAVENYGVRADLLNQAFRLGDVLILDVKTVDGHVAIINTIDFVKGILTLTESNYNLDQKVHHTRQISITDPAIVGIMRGKPLFPWPTIKYPLNPKVAVIFNNLGVSPNPQPWANQNQYLNQIRDWFFKNSGGKIQMEIAPLYSFIENIPTVASGGGMGSAMTEIIDEAWYEKYISGVYYGHDIYIFVMRPQDFAGQVYNQNGVMEYGYSYEPHYPIKTFVACDGNTDYPPDYADPDLQGFAKFAVHEICHGLYGVCLSDKFGSGTDLTHNHLYGENNTPINPADVFGDWDLDYLAQKIN